MAAQLFTTPAPALDPNGVPYSGAKWYFYASGTTTPQAVYSDVDLTTSLGAVVTADSSGRFPQIYLDLSLQYRAVLQNASGSDTLDDIDPYNTGFSAIYSDLASTTGAGLIGVSSDADYPSNTVGSNLNRLFKFTNPTFVLNSLGTAVPANGVYMGAGGNSLSFTNELSTPPDGADTDNQRATLLVVAETSDDGNSQEQTFNVLTTISTGLVEDWTPSTSYPTLGANVYNGTNTYRLTQVGTSAASGGPTGKGINIVDGTCRWKWINDRAITSKVGSYFETAAVAGAGHSWCSAFNMQYQDGFRGGFGFTAEMDCTNFSGVDSVYTGGYDKYNLALYSYGPNTSTSILEIVSQNTVKPAVHWAIRINGPNVAGRSVINIDTNSAVGLGFGLFAGGLRNTVFTDTVIKDGSTAPTGISFGGTYSSAGISVSGTTPSSYVSSGTKTLAGVFDTSTAPHGIVLSGTYSSSPIKATLGNYANDAAAAAGGVNVGGFYRNGSVVMVRVT